MRLSSEDQQDKGAGQKIETFYDLVYAVVRQIPEGKVINYGRVAQLLDRPKAARAVGYALNALADKPEGEKGVPWWRVVGQGGRITIANREWGGHEQAERLRAEGVVVDEALRLPNFSADFWWGDHFAVGPED